MQLQPCFTLPARVAAGTSIADERLLLADGRQVRLAPVQVQDGAAEQAFVAALSPASRYRRFQHGLRELPPAVLAAFTQADQHQHVALVARDASGPADGPIVADARFIRSADSCDAEFAIAVADAWQGAGLGRELLMRLLAEARRHGAWRLFGDVLWDNAPMLSLARGLGAGLGRHPVDPALVRAQFVVPSAARGRA